MNDMTPIKRLAKDIKLAAITLSDQEARYLVDSYYQMQGNRIRADGQIRSMEDEPNAVLDWLSEQSRTLENQVKGALDNYTKSHLMGDWMRSIKGIGPVISAGMLAHIDIHKAPTVGHIWSFAGLDPRAKWNKNEKRPWNAQLKVLCWKAGESFVKVSGHDDAFYGKIYLQRKATEQQKNDRGEFADQAAAALEKKRIGKSTDAYKHYSNGTLPPAHIHARACRYAAKMFLSHLHATWYEREFGERPPEPYPIAHLGHAHYVAPPKVN